jgi:hypothetical protein
MVRQATMHIYQLYRKEFWASLAALAGSLMLVFSLAMAPAAGAMNIGGPSDCDSNAVIRCGAHSTSALQHAYNSSAYVRGVFAAFGINSADMSDLASTNVAGRVTKSGDVFVDGKSKPVATDAMTGGRQNMAGSTKVNSNGAVFYRRPPSASFQQNSLPAFVAMHNGRFQFAVIASCGNAVSAKPTAPVKHHVAVAPAKPVSKPKQQKPAAKPAPSKVVVNSTNVNTNVNTQKQTQINKQSQAVQQTKAKPTAQPQSTAQTSVAQPSSQSTATTLPNTGPTGVIGAFLTAVGLGTLAYRRLLLKRFSE